MKSEVDKRRDARQFSRRAAELRQSSDFTSRLSGYAGAVYNAPEDFLWDHRPAFSSPAWEDREEAPAAMAIWKAACPEEWDTQLVFQVGDYLSLIHI